MTKELKKEKLIDENLVDEQVTKEQETEDVASTEEIVKEQETENAVSTEEIVKEQETENIASTEEIVKEQETENIASTEEIVKEQETENVASTEEIVKEQETENVASTEEIVKEQETENIASTEEIVKEQETENIASTEEIVKEQETENVASTEEIVKEQETENVASTEEIVKEQETENIASTEEIVKEQETENATSTEEIVKEQETENIASTEEIVKEQETENAVSTEEIVKEQETENVVSTEEIVKEQETETPKEEFDWNLDEKIFSSYSASEEKDMKDMYLESLNSIKEKEVVEGIVVAITSREVLVNIGSKSEGIISRNEFKYNPELKVNDKVKVFVEEQEDVKGQLLLSHKKARAINSWNKVNKALETGEIITGYIKCRTKGGMIVDIFGIEAFLPGSQIDVKPIRDYDKYVDKNMEFKVVKINQEFKNVVISHKALIEDELEEQRKEIISKLEKGQVLEGVVKNTTSYGVFIDLGGIDGLIHITDLSWGRISHPNEVVELDQKLNVVILDFDNNKKRIALGLKQLTPHPWESFDEKIKEGDEIEGKVVIITDYGAFVEVAPGIEGLIHVSEMSWSQNLKTAQDFLKIGDIIKVKILNLNREEKKMSFGIKQLSEDPWNKIEINFPIGSKHTAKVCNFTGFGIFVELIEGVDGLVHISDLSWTKKIKHPSDFTKIGSDLEVSVLEIDKENRRLSLGHKQTEENPWEVFEPIFTEGSIHEGTITKIEKKQAKVSLPYGIEGICPIKGLIKEDKSVAKIDETLEFKVFEFSKNTRKIVVSHAAVYKEDKRKTKTKKNKTNKDSINQNNQNLEKTTLGDLGGLDKLNFKDKK